MKALIILLEKFITLKNKKFLMLFGHWKLCLQLLPFRLEFKWSDNMQSPTVEDLHFYIDKNKIELKGNNAYTIETTDALVYPNPVKDKFILNLPDGFALEKIEILDLSGRAAPFKPTNQTPLQIDISSLSNGIYLLKAIGLNGEVYVEKIIKVGSIKI